MKILIIVPRMAQPSHDYRRYVIPIGLAYISSALKHSHHEVDFLNLNFCDGSVEDMIKKTLSKKEYDYMLTGGLCTHYSAIKNCVDLVRKHSPFIKIVLGGGLISSRPELMFKMLQPDYMVIGEGELTILELLEYLKNKGDLSEVDGIAYREPEGKVILTKPREPIKDIDSLPRPDYEGLGLDSILEQIKPSTIYMYDLFDNPRPYPLIVSRSCPYLCTFCYHPIGNRYRQRSIPNVIDEIAFAIERYKINLIDIYDELLSNDKERVYDLCKQLKQLFASVPWEVKWSCQLRVDTITEELVETMKGAGCYLISFGLESYSSDVLKSMKKRITPQQIDNALRITYRLHMTITGNFIFGDTAETTETVYETLKYWKKNYHTFLGGAVALGHVQVYPGAPIYEHALKKGVITNELDFIENHLGEPINITNNMSEEEFKQLQIDINDAMLSYPHRQRPLISRKINGVYETHVRCPYCNVISIYKNYVPPGKDSYQQQAICCRNCRMRFLVASLTNKLHVFLLKMIDSKHAHFLSLAREVYKTIIRYCRKISFFLQRHRQKREGEELPTLVPKIRFATVFAILFMPLAAILVLVVRALRPVIVIRFGKIISERIGHFAANTELYLCERDVGMQDRRTLDIFYYNAPVCNRQLKKMWSRILRVSYFVYPVDKFNRFFPGYRVHVVPIPSDRDIHELLVRIPAHLSFTTKEERRGRAVLRKLGIREGVSFICFHARDSAYLDTIWPQHVRNFRYHDYRDSSIHNYLPAAEELTQRGYYAIRMGMIVKEKLTTTNPMIIDYATNTRNDFLDIYLSAKCHFFICDTAGINAIPRIFRRPIVYVNIVPLEDVFTSSQNSLFIPKKLWLQDKGRFLAFRETFDSGVWRFSRAEEYDRLGIKVVENTPEEISAVAIEMDDRLKGVWQATEEDEDLQRRFWSLFKVSKLNKTFKLRIGTEFLRQNRRLLE